MTPVLCAADCLRPAEYDGLCAYHYVVTRAAEACSVEARVAAVGRSRRREPTWRELWPSPRDGSWVGRWNEEARR